jgi:Family of unknown function (DUF6328)
MASDGGGSEHESEKERLDRELIEFLNELRVALPGVQVLFAFLLIVPFTNGWDGTTDFQRDVYFATLLLTTLATLFLIAPSANHRLRFRKRDKKYLLTIGNHFAIAGLALLALGTGGAVLLITDLVFGSPAAGIVAGLTTGLAAWLWFGLPLLRTARHLERD